MSRRSQFKAGLMAAVDVNKKGNPKPPITVPRLQNRSAPQEHGSNRAPEANPGSTSNLDRAPTEITPPASANVNPTASLVPLKRQPASTPITPASSPCLTFMVERDTNFLETLFSSLNETTGAATAVQAGGVSHTDQSHTPAKELAALVPLDLFDAESPEGASLSLQKQDENETGAGTESANAKRNLLSAFDYIGTPEQPLDILTTPINVEDLNSIAEEFQIVASYSNEEGEDEGTMDFNHDESILLEEDIAKTLQSQWSCYSNNSHNTKDFFCGESHNAKDFFCADSHNTKDYFCADSHSNTCCAADVL
ncbi:uncharacterized protein LOC117640408 [Thrips palmi]|uniref:Uncharacterized protein LOC117640408 n=1 Tax=Thrips palmi TaxID=161013 RepID=A0A6P8ZI12_THRPL|nr:uncharacterized protein LOC117640408 [Thrips palmi]